MLGRVIGYLIVALVVTNSLSALLHFASGNFVSAFFDVLGAALFVLLARQSLPRIRNVIHG